MTRSTCRGCGRPIVWIQTSAGKSMPCNTVPVPYWAKPKAAGKVITQNGEVISCELKGDLSKATGLGYVSHFSTCPQASKFKKKSGVKS